MATRCRRSRSRPRGFSAGLTGYTKIRRIARIIRRQSLCVRFQVRRWRLSSPGAGHGSSERLGQATSAVGVLFAVYAVSWCIAIPLALQAQGVLGTHLPWALHYLTAFGPAAAALTVARILREPLGDALPVQQDAFSRRAVWWTIGFGSPLLLFVVAQLAAGMAGQPVPGGFLSDASTSCPISGWQPGCYGS